MWHCRPHGGDWRGHHLRGSPDGHGERGLAEVGEWEPGLFLQAAPVRRIRGRRSLRGRPGACEEAQTPPPRSSRTVAGQPGGVRAGADRRDGEFEGARQRAGQRGRERKRKGEEGEREVQGGRGEEEAEEREQFLELLIQQEEEEEEEKEKEERFEGGSRERAEPSLGGLGWTPTSR